MGPELLGNLLVVAAARDEVSKMLVESLRKWRRKERWRSFCAVTPACAAWSRPASATKLSCSRLSATDNSAQHTQPVSQRYLQVIYNQHTANWSNSQHTINLKRLL